MAPTSTPVENGLSETRGPAVVIEGAYMDERTGALYIHKDLEIAAKPWEHEDHIRPVHENVHFGDVESWVEYVKSYAGSPDHAPLLTWNKGLMRAVLDYHTAEGPGRASWIATYPFKLSRQWEKWKTLTHSGVSQADAIERLEDMANDIASPTAAEVMNILRHLRGTMNKSVEIEHRPDGTTAVRAAADQTISARGGAAELPESIEIGIPLLEGLSTTYKLIVRIRAGVGNGDKLFLRFSIPNAEASLEDAYMDRVNAAKVLLASDGDKHYKLLRAAD